VLSVRVLLLARAKPKDVGQIALAQVDKEINVWLVRKDVRINQGFVCGLFSRPAHTPKGS